MARKIPEILNIDEQKMLLQVFNKRYFNSRRNRCMINLFLNTGLRLSEMLALKWKDINLMTGQLKIIDGKGGNDRIIWINDDMLQEVCNWREDQFENLGKVEYVFSTREGKRLKDSDIRQMVYKYSEKALSKRISPHILRHTYATDLYRQTKDIRLVQKALGHADLSTTMIYTHIGDDELENALKSFRTVIN